MLLGTLSVSADFAPAAGADVASIRAHYAAALERCQATVTPGADDELVFTVSMRAPERLGFRTPDLGMIASGTLEIIPSATGYRVVAQVQPRSWFTLAALLPWLTLIWAIGIGTAPWHYLLAAGGLPVVVLLWLVVWTNVHAFLQHTHEGLIDAQSHARG